MLTIMIDMIFLRKRILEINIFEKSGKNETSSIYISNRQLQQILELEYML